MQRMPHAYGTALVAVERHLAERRQIAVAGAPDDPRTAALVAAARRGLGPHDVLAVGDPDDDEVVSQTPLLADRPLVDGAPAAYVCRHFTCRAPVTDPEELSEVLSAAG
jgi:uncharacterized protein YyaL (SSP411 family)